MATPLVSIVPFILLVTFSCTGALAQETTDEHDLRSVINTLRNGSPDYDDMEPALRIAVREQNSSIIKFLNSLGPTRSIQFEETANGVDVYFVQFRNGRTIWQFARSHRGRIAVLYFNAF